MIPLLFYPVQQNSLISTYHLQLYGAWDMSVRTNEMRKLK